MTADPVRKLVALAVATARLKHDDLFRSVFVTISDTLVDDFGHAVLAILDKPATMDAWGWACSRIPWSSWRRACREWQEDMDRRRAAFMPPARSSARSDLCRFAFRLLRGKATAEHFARRMREANGTLVEPLEAGDLDKLAAWCVERHSERDGPRGMATRA